MKNRDYLAERLSDVKNLDEYSLMPGQYTSLELAVFYPCGIPF